LKKRLFSCPAAFLTTLEQHEKSLQTARRKVAKPSYKTLQLEFDRMEEEYASDSEYDEATADALDTATRLFAEPTADEEALLKQMKEWAKRARGQRDSKAKQLVTWLKEHLKPVGSGRRNGSSFSPNTGPPRTGSKRFCPCKDSRTVTGS